MPLEPEDRAMLALEGPTVAGHTCRVIEPGDAPDVPALRRTVAERLPAAPVRVDAEASDLVAAAAAA